MLGGGNKRQRVGIVWKFEKLTMFANDKDSLAHDSVQCTSYSSRPKNKLYNTKVATLVDAYWNHPFVGSYKNV